MRFVQAGVMVLGAAIYLFFIFTAGPYSGMDPELYINLLQWTVLGWNLALLVVTVLVIIDSVRKVRRGMTAQFVTAAVTVKLAAIPFFLINFILMALVGLAGLALSVHGIGIPLVFVAAISVVLTYLAMVSTSVYGWASVVRLRRERHIGIARTIVYPILLLVFVADIAVGIALFAHADRGRARGRVGLALAIVLVETLAVLALPGYAIKELNLAWLSDIFVLAIVATTAATGVLAWVAHRRHRGREAPQELGPAESDEARGN